MRRKIYDDLVTWKNRHHKCLLISGQRGIGKTTIVREFASKEYEHLAELDFSTMRDASKVFEGDRNVDSITLRWNIFHPDAVLVPGKTLLFLDEIQCCDKALSALKPLTEDGRFDVVACESPMLEPEINGVCALFPMGYVEILRMYGLDFEEFLWARGIAQNVIDGLKKCIKEKSPIDPVILETMERYYREFMITGGMPEAVSCFIEDGDFVRMKTVLSNLNTECLRDINRYNRGVDIAKTTECFESIPNQLTESNKKFMYSRIHNEQSRKASDEYLENLFWLKNAGYGNFCYGIVAPTIPIRMKRAVFKVYLSDTGMLVNMYGDDCIRAIYSGDLKFNLGAVTENAVAEALIKAGYTPRYFTEQKGDRRMELDFVLSNGDGIVVIEVKSGKDRTAPSIHKASTYYDIPTRIILSEENIHSDESGILHLPLFAACFLRELEPVWDGPRIN